MSDTPATPRRDPVSVYRVVQLVGTSAESWEQAATSALTEAAKSIPDLRVAQVVELDTAVRDGVVAAYRVRLKGVLDRIDRRRRTASGETQVVRRYLVVANQTAGGPALSRAIRALNRGRPGRVPRGGAGHVVAATTRRPGAWPPSAPIPRRATPSATSEPCPAPMRRASSGRRSGSTSNCCS